MRGVARLGDAPGRKAECSKLSFFTPPQQHPHTTPHHAHTSSSSSVFTFVPHGRTSSDVEPHSCLPSAPPVAATAIGTHCTKLACGPVHPADCSRRVLHNPGPQNLHGNQPHAVSASRERRSPPSPPLLCGRRVHIRIWSQACSLGVAAGGGGCAAFSHSRSWKPGGSAPDAPLASMTTVATCQSIAIIRQ